MVWEVVGDGDELPVGKGKKRVIDWYDCYNQLPKIFLLTLGKLLRYLPLYPPNVILYLSASSATWNVVQVVEYVPPPIRYDLLTKSAVKISPWIRNPGKNILITRKVQNTAQIWISPQWLSGLFSPLLIPDSQYHELLLACYNLFLILFLLLVQ